MIGASMFSSLFLSTPSARRATAKGLAAKPQPAAFLSTPSARRATCSRWSVHRGMSNFYPRPPRGGRLLTCCSSSSSVISIHALREEGDPTTSSSRTRTHTFLSTPSARRATISSLYPADCSGFLSTPSARRATRNVTGQPSADSYFYPRPPRGGRLSHFRLMC